MNSTRSFHFYQNQKVPGSLRFFSEFAPSRSHSWTEQPAEVDALFGQGEFQFQQGKIINSSKPGDSKWPFHPLVGGHDSPFQKVTFSPSQKGHYRRTARKSKLDIFGLFLWGGVFWYVFQGLEFEKRRKVKLCQTSKSSKHWQEQCGFGFFFLVGLWYVFLMICKKKVPIHLTFWKR